ncbi:MAG: ribosomal protein S18-alanine N-acetyltransferase [Firmicutes bacterium]|nr:ribosomal protein S18-alanine N-acetyltransferase [Bacillota bacterium]
MNSVIRYMKVEDVDQIVLADRLVLGHTLGKETMINELEINPFAHYFLMEDQESKELLGHLSIWIDSPMAQILNLYVLPKYQEHGFGKKFIEFAIDYMKSFNVKELTLEVRPSNERAIILYKNYGFTQVAIRRNYYDNGEDAFLMLKRM